MFFLNKHKRVAWQNAGALLGTIAAEKQSKLLREYSYDAVAYTAEQAAKNMKAGNRMSSQDKLACAVSFLRTVMPQLKEETAVALVESILAKVVGEGATQQRKV